MPSKLRVATEDLHRIAADTTYDVGDVQSFGRRPFEDDYDDISDMKSAATKKIAYVLAK